MTDNETRVVHVKDNVPGAIYIGRAMPRQKLKASPFANPFKIGDPYPGLDNHPERRRMDRFAVVMLYGVAHLQHSARLWALLPELRGKPLACWCRRDGEAVTGENLCHGDFLVDLLNKHTDDELRAMAGEFQA